LAVFSGTLVGFTLGLVGGGGSILAVPLLVYVVGVQSPHVAIGTSAVAVAASAAANLFGHARARNVKWSCAIVFAAFGMIGAAGGAALGKMVDGGKLLAMFGVLMVIIGLLMLRPRRSAGDAGVRLSFASAPRLLPKLIGFGLAVGLLSGFFGIGGGFLIVPGLVGATAMPLINAIGSSLFAVTAFGLTTAVSYALSGLVDLAPRRPVCDRWCRRRRPRHLARCTPLRAQTGTVPRVLCHCDHSRCLCRLCHGFDLGQ
jgi:hypothetical protein